METLQPIDTQTVTADTPVVEPFSWNWEIEEHYEEWPDGPLEVLRDPTRIDSLKHAVRVGVIAVAELGVDLGLLYSGERVFRADHRGLPNPSPSYKGRTEVGDVSKQVSDTYMRMHGVFVKGEHDTKTKLGKFLSRISADEIPNIIIHVLTGDLKIFGKGRQVQAEEMIGKLMLDGCQDLQVAPREVSEGMDSGVCNETATMLQRIMDRDGTHKFIRASIKRPDQLSTRRKRLRATLSKDFLTQTSSVAQERTPLGTKRKRRISDRTEKETAA